MTIKPGPAIKNYHKPGFGNWSVLLLNKNQYLSF